MNESPSRKNRQVRVFISSTFRDFMGERDELVKKVFPELRHRCKARFVELLEIDLRWGITEEQSRQGETLRICLNEIDRCRPSSPVFFIGLLGERYGWIPQKDFYPQSVLNDPELKWVNEHVGGKSVTELEILHGVLNNPAMAERAFFYFRADGYEKRHWQLIQQSHPDLLPEDFTNAREAKPNAATRKQQELKRRIFHTKLKHAACTYETPEELAERVLNDLWPQIDAAYPASEVPDALEQEALDHKVFRDSRSRAYVEREGLFDELDAHARGEGPSIRVILGGSGSGKSALLAAWLAQNEDKVVFFHFAGATPQSMDAEGMLRRLLETLRLRSVVPLSSQIPPDPLAMAALLSTWLQRLADNGGGVLLVDALNQLGSARDRELWWWPLEWPENVRVVFSTLPGDVLRELEKRGWNSEDHCITVPPLRSEEKQSILNLYLRLFARKLDESLQRIILDAPQTSNPLFLRTVLDELRLRSRHEDLGMNLASMLECEEPAALFVRVLKNLEQDFTPAEHPGLVHRALGLMGVAQRGLTESELLELLSKAPEPVKQPLPRHYWSPLYLALEDSLVSREGQLGFFHDYLRQAVLREYLDEEHELIAAHERMAETVTHWSEDGHFGASLRHYGFANGIKHLLLCEKLDTALEFVLDLKYRETAVLALCAADMVQRDVASVRVETARKANTTARVAAQLTIQALQGREQLTRFLREILDTCARNGRWEEVMGLAAAGKDTEERVRLGLRAIARSCSSAPEDFRKLMVRWTQAIGKREWSEVAERAQNKNPGSIN